MKVMTLFSVTLLLCPLISAAGDPVNINVTGNIVSTSCGFSSDSFLQTIQLGEIGKGTLATAGAASEWVPLKINVLEDCPTATRVTIKFTGEADDQIPTEMYKNSGTAQNVAIQLQGAGGEALGNGSTYIRPIGDVPSFQLRSRIYSKGKATQGTVKAVVTIELTYL